MHLAPYIDHTLLKPATTLNDVEKICSEAAAYGFASVCLPPYFVAEAARLLSGTPVKVATVIGFPFGYHHYRAKAAEAEKAIEEGAQELDMVMNIAAFKNSDFQFLEKEITEIISLSKQTLFKVIIETGILTDEEIITCCHFYKHFTVDFLKTSTGYAEKGATVEAVRLMRTHLPGHIQVKASGGIKTYAFAQSLIEAGATRLGCSASIAVVQGGPPGESSY